LNVRYGSLVAVCVLLIFWLSSLPDLAVREAHPLVLLLSNLAHVPIFGALAYCVVRALAGSGRVNREHYVAAFTISIVLAVLDEWHQSFVPGRDVSVGDLLLDGTGIVAVLFWVRLRGFPIGERCSAR
jgi:VanZ family protein